MTRSLPLVLLLLAALAPCGCVQLEEDLALSADGSGSYELVLTWDQDLLDEAVALVGPAVADRFRGRDLPLTLEAWREGLTDLRGVTVRNLTLEEEDGLRTVRLQVRFRHLRDLLGWELFARRGLVIEPVEGADGPPLAALRMTPLARVPYLDPVAAALAARSAPVSEEVGALHELDPPPLERLGISPLRAEQAQALLAPHLPEVRFRFRVRVPGALEPVGPGGETTRHGALFTRGFEDLTNGRQRQIRLRWKPRPLDPIPSIDHEGDRPTTAGGAR